MHFFNRNIPLRERFVLRLPKQFQEHITFFLSKGNGGPFPPFVRNKSTTPIMKLACSMRTSSIWFLLVMKWILCEHPNYPYSAITEDFYSHEIVSFDDHILIVLKRSKVFSLRNAQFAAFGHCRALWGSLANHLSAQSLAQDFRIIMRGTNDHTNDPKPIEGNHV